MSIFNRKKYIYFFISHNYPTNKNPQKHCHIKGFKLFILLGICYNISNVTEYFGVEGCYPFSFILERKEVNRMDILLDLLLDTVKILFTVFMTAYANELVKKRSNKRKRTTQRRKRIGGSKKK